MADDNNKSSTMPKLTSKLVLIVILVVSLLIFVNYKALGMATGATGSTVKHGFALTFLQPFYTLWAIIYLFTH